MGVHIHQDELIQPHLKFTCGPALTEGIIQRTNKNRVTMGVLCLIYSWALVKIVVQSNLIWSSNQSCTLCKTNFSFGVSSMALAFFTLYGHDSAARTRRSVEIAWLERAKRCVLTCWLCSFPSHSPRFSITCRKQWIMSVPRARLRICQRQFIELF